MAAINNGLGKTNLSHVYNQAGCNFRGWGSMRLFRRSSFPKLKMRHSVGDHYILRTTKNGTQ
ncbi:hypothetical protein M514_01204 [Trichuris suis]|uniref:Uncharacterized protein n=1 Tax=Trichuris suis TaxID=68888 RepID=A0A085ML75_9BILA|nr:hypothetical protein M513_01204 [Trichuris suis]KFD70844.1 hypothetical protein M514_01204 [Trichuris suis]